MGRPKSDLTHRQIAMDLHDLLDVPLDHKGNPSLGTKIIRIMIDAMVRALHSGEDIIIDGFGVFRVITRKPTRAHNVVVDNKFNGAKSPVPIDIPARKVVVFNPSTILQALLNKDNPQTCDEKRTLNRHPNLLRL